MREVLKQNSFKISIKNYRSNLIKSLLNYSVIVDKVVKGRISISRFVKDYDNFFYYEALDGHEASQEQKKILEEFKVYIKFHKDVQDVVNEIYFEDDLTDLELEKIGRLTKSQAEKKLIFISRSKNLDKLILDLYKVDNE